MLCVLPDKAVGPLFRAPPTTVMPGVSKQTTFAGAVWASVTCASVCQVASSDATACGIAGFADILRLWRAGMPFAEKFCAMMDLPLVGDTVGGFAVESVDASDEPSGPGLYAYSVRITLQGPGGKQGVRQALKALFSSHSTTFSGYGNPYQLWFGKPEIESLGNKRYAVKVQGAGARVFLEDELHRFLRYLNETDQLSSRPDQAVRETVVETYLERYRAEIRRKVYRYQRKLQRTNDGGA